LNDGAIELRDAGIRWYFSSDSTSKMNSFVDPISTY